MTMNSDFTVLPVNILQNVGPNEKTTPGCSFSLTKQSKHITCFLSVANVGNSFENCITRNAFMARNLSIIC
jgi:hypothetical protein